MTPDGVPYLAPEVQLLYKAQPETLQKDQIDFDAVVSLLDAEAGDWLLSMLRRRFPQGHPWISVLAAPRRS